MINLYQLKFILGTSPDKELKIELPNGDLVPAHFHVTEVGRVQKNFIDCGGTRRNALSCVLQVWVANDVDHRLTPEKLLKILDLSDSVLETTDLPVEIEYGEDVASLYHLVDVMADATSMCFVLGGKKTDCLAKDKCGITGCC